MVTGRLADVNKTLASRSKCAQLGARWKGACFVPDGSALSHQNEEARVSATGALGLSSTHAWSDV